MADHYFSEKQQNEFRSERFEVQLGDNKIIINSGSGIFSLKEMDFGTKIMIENAKMPLLNKTKQETELLDLGCGYGIVGIAMKMIHPNINVTMCDINERAIWLTKKNIEENDVVCSIYKSDIFSNPEICKKKFDIIMTNPPFSAGKKTCKEFITQSFDHLNKNGLFELIAPHNKGGESLKKIMHDTFGNVEEYAKKRGYRLYVSEKK